MKGSTIFQGSSGPYKQMFSIISLNLKFYRFPKQKIINKLKSMTTLQNSFNITFTGSTVYGKLGLTSPQSRIESKIVDYCFFHDLIINPSPYKGLNSLARIQNSNMVHEDEQYTNPKTSFYLCKKYLPSIEFQKMPRYLMKRLAYRRKNQVDEWGRVVYNDPFSKNYDQIATEYHCLNLLKGSYRAIQLISVLHENTRCKEDKRFFYHSLKLPDRREKNIKNICFIIEEMNKGSLREQMQSNMVTKKHFPFEKVMEYTCQIAEGLLQLREKGIIHRDLRPDNVLVHNDQIKFADFDSAFIRGYSDYRNIKNGVDMKDTTPLQIMMLIAESEQNLQKMSSDQLYEKQKKADIYFLGVNIYTMVFNQAFESFNGGRILKNLVNIKKREGISPKLLDMMESCLQKDPHMRIELDGIIKILSQIELELYFSSSSYKRVYLSPESLNLQSFTANDISRQRKTNLDLSSKEEIHQKEQMDKQFQNTLKNATLQRNTSLFEGLFKKVIQQVENMELWFDNQKSKLFKINKNHLREKIDAFLERLQIKAFFYELAYRILCEINLTVIKSPIFFENIRTHIELFSSQLVVLLNFLYETILKCSFTSDPHYDHSNPSYEARKVIENIKTFYSRWQFFSGRLQLQKKINEQKKKMKNQLDQLKRTIQGQDLKKVIQFEQNFKVTYQGIKIFESMLNRFQKLNNTEYDSIEQRFSFGCQEINTMKCLQKIESIVKNQMIQTIINLIIAYEEIKLESWGHRSNLKNSIFMIMILDAQNTQSLKKNEIVIIKQELFRMINLKIGWKSQQLEAFFNNYTQTHKEEVMKGLGQLQSQAVLAPPPESQEEICIQVLGSDKGFSPTEKKAKQNSLEEVEKCYQKEDKLKVNDIEQNFSERDKVIQKTPEVQQLQLKETFQVKLFDNDLKEKQETSKKKSVFLQVQQNIGVENLESIDLE